MNGFRTFLATLQFEDDRPAHPIAEVVEANATETAEADQEQVDQQLAA